MCARRKQRDGVVVALAHLAAVQTGQGGDVVFNFGLGRHKVIAIAVVEAVRHVARHLDVLHLVAPDRYLVRVEHQNVGAHQHRVHEQPGADIGLGVNTCGGIFVDRRLVGVRPVQHALANDTGQQPGELRNFRDIGLAIEDDALGVQPGGQPTGGYLQRGALDACRFINLDQGVVVGQKIKTLDIGPQAGPHRRPDGADIVAEMGGAGGGDAGQKTRGTHREGKL